MTQPDKLMREALEKLLSVEHERGGVLGLDGQFNYYVPESVFRKAKEALQQRNKESEAKFDNPLRDAFNKVFHKDEDQTKT